LYLNGLPLVFIELKNSNHPVQNAFDDNLTRYKADIPQLFLFNAVCILSNALETRVGSFNSAWEFFFTWLRPDDETEKIDRDGIRAEGISIERAIDGLCPPDRLLDYLENFILFYKDTEKIIAQNHQFLGVNKAFTRLHETLTAPPDEKSKLGVFWHTQGSGKSFSMIFYTRKIFRKLPGNYTFVIITDRDDLDGQIYRNFLNTDTVKKNEAAQPKNSEEMRHFLTQNKRLVFTLIQKFRYPKGKQYPILSRRDDIIVIVDEAHRTQYKDLAENMRAGLPNARFLAFTGTPLLGPERKTNQWFGDYVSEYNFTQSIDDGATVPLFYEKRVPEVLIQNEALSDEFYEILEDENLDDLQQAKLENQFSEEKQIIIRDDRLDKIARDIVYHFPRRGYLGKGMVVSVDKFTAVKMYDKVSAYWKQERTALVKEIQLTKDQHARAKLAQRLNFMRQTEMAVVVSEDAGEEKKFTEQGLVIQPHRARMNKLDEQGHDIEHNFKDPAHPLRLVFVCAMWLTGFDAPTVSTLYLDKPMKDHTLMQAIARANRVSSFLIDNVQKKNGEIIDYYNVFRSMKKALAAYAAGGNGQPLPVQDKTALFALLDQALAEGVAYCKPLGIDLETLDKSNEVFKNLAQFEAYANLLFSKDEYRKAFTVYENTITALYEACKPEIFQRDARRLVYVFQYLRGVLDAIIDRLDLSTAALRITALLDESVVATDKPDGIQDEKAAYQIIQTGKQWDLSKLNVEKLKAEFVEKPYKHLEIADLRAFLEHKLAQLLKENVTRTDFAERLQRIIDQYNAGGSATEQYFEDLMNYGRDLSEEAERHIREGLSPAELELFDLLKKEKMTQAEEIAVKNAARALLKRLKEETPKVLVQDWYQDTQSQHRVKDAVEEVLHRELPQSYDRSIFKKVCDVVYQVIFESAFQGLGWAG
ncbi:MAG: type I restriction endonuclease subunit R, partial [Anaerolineales bacterium]|nr:type I restriction endonuclease subunit R [Anaerolineales bacterium]